MIEKEELDKYNLKPISYKKINNCIILQTKKETLAFKKIKSNKEKLFNYLKLRNFTYLPEYRFDSKYEISEYIKENDIDDNTKIEDIIKIIATLHLKTTAYKNISIDEIKEIYENLNNQINQITNYYKELNILIDEEIFMSPSSYLLVRNITKLYNVLNYCKTTLDDWYSKMKEKNKIRVVQLHNNLSLDHIIEGEKKVLISWDNSKKDIPIYDIYNLYKKYYKDFDFSDLLDLYESKYPLQDYEKTLLLILISIPKKIEFSLNEYENTKAISNLYTYISKNEEIISPYYSKYENE